MEAGVTMASLPLTLCGVPMFQVSPRVHVAMWRVGVDIRYVQAPFKCAKCGKSGVFTETFRQPPE